MVHYEGFGHKKCEIIRLTLQVLFFSLKQRNYISGSNSANNWLKYINKMLTLY